MVLLCGRGRGRLSPRRLLYLSNRPQGRIGLSSPKVRTTKGGQTAEVFRALGYGCSGGIHRFTSSLPNERVFRHSGRAGLPSSNIHPDRGFGASSALRSDRRNRLPLRPPLRYRSPTSYGRTFRIAAGDYRRSGDRNNRGTGTSKAIPIEAPLGQNGCSIILPPPLAKSPRKEPGGAVRPISFTHV